VLLVRHYSATAQARAEVILGVHVPAPDEACRWIAFDIDRHADEDAAASFRSATRIL
jgi:hypothetical protein